MADTITHEEHVESAYHPHAGQWDFHDSEAKFRAIITGIGFGKTATGCNESIKVAGLFPGSLGVIMAPTGKVLRNATLPQFFKFAQGIVLRHVESKNLIVLKNGARIIYLSADNQRHIDRLSGMEVGWFWMDEARLFRYAIWPMLLGRLRDKNGPLRGWATTSPNGRGGWLYKLFVAHEDPESGNQLLNAKDYAWFGGTTLENPHLPQEYKDTLLAAYTGKFLRQEVYGEFTTFEGMVYDNFTERLHVIEHPVIHGGTGPTTLKINDYRFPSLVFVKEWIAGIDWGFTNPMACLLVAVDADDNAYVLEEYYERQKDPKHLSAWLKAQAVQVHLKEVSDIQEYADPNRPEHISEFKTFEHSIRSANNEVMAGIQDVYDMFSLQGNKRPRLFISKRCKKLIEELGKYRYKEIKEDVEVKEEPIKKDDHAVDALRYVIRSHLGKVRGGFKPLSDPNNRMGLR